MNRYIWKTQLCYGYDEFGEAIINEVELSSIGEDPVQAEVNFMDQMLEEDCWHLVVHYRMVDIHWNIRTTFDE
jgi:hypothetical protein